MKQVFYLKSKSFSINAATYSDARTKTAEYYEWSAKVFHQLTAEDNQQKLKMLREFFDESKHSVKVSIKTLYPKETFITKANILSSKTQDLSNTEKLLIDLFFDKRFHEKSYPYGCNNLCINDKNIISLYSTKDWHDSDQPAIEFSVKIVPRKF